MIPAGRVPGSFRDPTGSVYAAGGKIFRGVSQDAGETVRALLGSAFFKRHAGAGIVDTRLVDVQQVSHAGLPDVDAQRFPVWMEHERLEFISYPYEWSFELLKSAALLQVQLHIEALEAGFDVKDASAYNIQFRGCKPVFIDIPSFAPYRENAYWIGYKQFCEHFLAPLALNAYARVDFNHWFRGALEGIDIVSASRLLPLRSFFSPSLLMNIHAQAWAMSRVKAVGDAPRERQLTGLPRKNYVHLLQSLQRFISGLQAHGSTFWADYKNDSSYSAAGAREKEALVMQFLQDHAVRRLLDVGCNTGHYSQKAIEAGVQYVVGTDFDTGALNVAVQTATRKGLNITPVLLDVCNPSPAMGWNLAEREPLLARLPPMDASIHLAVMHHVVIGKNIPLQEYADWVVRLAPRGLVEFVPKSDPMVAGLLAHREDVFPDYSQDRFVQLLGRHAQVVAIRRMPATDRVLIEFVRT